MRSLSDERQISFANRISADDTLVRTELVEENPMLGFRGASRYYNE
jgi:phosphoenolpyruvate synthase/pyruvate phosphate dikinase